ncbi:unnamed protein product [Effrenium voratum]|uniref:Methyltransferase domain-containing protein n=1 Tax=Effrenium voratum TaxID=2562239 RepID=A0AA36MQE1_9DINO|nr:unnamed protein product [Effrenium voratum]
MAIAYRTSQGSTALPSKSRRTPVRSKAQTGQSALSATMTTLRRPSSTPAAGGQRPMTRSMDKQPLQYWNQQARNYDDNIFSSIDEDANGIIAQVIERCGDIDAEGPRSRCIDLGCGAGKYLPKLARHFKTVDAYDLSPKLVALAEKEVKKQRIQNVRVSVRDLSQIWYRNDATSAQLGHVTEMESFGFAVMANVLIAPQEASLHQLMLKNAYRSLMPGGRLLCIVPSWESAMYVNMRCDEENYDGPYSVGANGEKPTRTEGADLLCGVLRRSGVRTKHFLEPEFQLLASRAGFDVAMCKRVSYTWRSELGLAADCQVPTRLRESPLPWDWMFLLQRGRDVAERPGWHAVDPLAKSDSERLLPTLFQKGRPKEEDISQDLIKLVDSQKSFSRPHSRASPVSH